MYFLLGKVHMIIGLKPFPFAIYIILTTYKYSRIIEIHFENFELDWTFPELSRNDAN